MPETGEAGSLVPSAGAASAARPFEDVERASVTPPQPTAKIGRKSASRRDFMSAPREKSGARAPRDPLSDPAVALQPLLAVPSPSFSDWHEFVEIAPRRSVL